MGVDDTAHGSCRKLQYLARYIDTPCTEIVADRRQLLTRGAHAHVEDRGRHPRVHRRETFSRVVRVASSCLATRTPHKSAPKR